MGFVLVEGKNMVCFKPIHAYYPISTVEDFYTKEQKRHILFRLPKYDYAVDCVNGSMYFDYLTKERETVLGDMHFITKDKIFVPGLVPKYVDVRIPCGKCLGCHADRARNYSTRAIHEYYAHREKKGAFITLTFNEDMLHRRDVLDYRSIYRSEFNGFLKRLRSRVKDKYGIEFRVFASGEYGELHLRPHYHMLVYGFDFPDKIPFRYRVYNGKKIVYYRSPFLESVWKPAGDAPSFGYSYIGELNQSTCQYVCGYVADKLDEFGERDYRQLGIEKPFFYTPSKTGLGYDYFMQYYQEIFAKGYCHWHNKCKAPIPPYYKDLLKKTDENMYNDYKLDKLKFLIDNLFIENLDMSEQRLLVREEALKMKYDKVIRSYEELSNLHNIYYNYLSKRYKTALKSSIFNKFIFDLKINDARKEIITDANKYDLIFLDAFTPAKCPMLWSVDFFKLLFEHLDDDGRILTYSNSATIRNAFINAGFYIGKIYNNTSGKFMGTIATKNKSLIKNDLSEYDLGLLKTKAGVFYRDKNLNGLNDEILATHKREVETSDLESSSHYIKRMKKVK